MTDRILYFAQMLQKLRDIGLDINERKLRRWCEPDATGRRKLPVFRNPLDGKLIIVEKDLMKVIETARQDALKEHTNGIHSQIHNQQRRGAISRGL